MESTRKYILTLFLSVILSVSITIGAVLYIPSIRETLRGPEGPVGPKGEEGPIGPIGSTGPEGPRGPAGDQDSPDSNLEGRDETSDPISSEDKTWLILEGTGYSVFYKEGYFAGAEKVFLWAKTAQEVTQQYYPHELDETVEIYLHDPMSWRHSAGYATADPWYGPQPQMHFLTPTIGDWRSEHWWQGNIIHEWVHIPTATHNRERGYDSAPFWLTEGIAEYIPSTILPRSGAGEEMITEFIKEGRGYLDDLGITYSGALHITGFLVEKWGWESYTDIFRCPASTFEEALYTVWGVTLDELEAEWIAWACEKYGVDPIVYAEGRQSPFFPDVPVEGEWWLEIPNWVLLGSGVPLSEINEFLTGKGLLHGFFGGSLDYIMKGLKEYRGGIENVHTLLFYNPSVEPISVLQEWPTDFSYLLPLTPSELQNEIHSMPFVYLRQDSKGRVRGIIVASNDYDFLRGLEYIASTKVQLNTVTFF